MSSSSPSTLESLPAELMLQILKSLPDIYALHSLIETSRIINVLYISHRSLVYTAVTINVLLARGVDVLTPAPFIEISQAGGRGNVKPILRSLHRQIQQKSGPLRLEPAERRILLSIRVLVLWKLKVDGDGEVVPVIHKEPSSGNYLYWDDHENREKELLCLAGKELSPDFVDRCFAFIENSFKPRRRIVYDAAYDEFMEEVRRHTCQRPRESSATLQFEQKN